MSDLIGRHARQHAQELSQDEGSEQAKLEMLTTRIESILADYNPSTLHRKSDPLVFGQLYAAARQPEPDEENGRVPSATVAALMAAEVEFYGPLRLSNRQNGLLAKEYELLGEQLSGVQLYAYAALAYRRGAALYRLNEDEQGQDGCGLQLARARTRATPVWWRRSAGQMSYALCGHGYRPSWLLGWVAVQLVLFTVVGLLFGGNPSATESVYMTVTGFLNPVGPGDIEHMHAVARPLFALEAWVGTLSMSVFFALLVRKWFRM
ncbi:hypothetical protein [Nocardia sp. NPDC005366]|uniref:hypothetical protein n=1 Tax=Nocardia sp. NPDC005366 TaxID=3156878 RepID=UPI0033B4E80B